MSALEIISRVLLTVWVWSSGLTVAGIDLGPTPRWLPTWLRLVIAIPMAIQVSVLIWTAP